jgi:tetratricopeptide (TPR) repeat protein
MTLRTLIASASFVMLLAGARPALPQAANTEGSGLAEQDSRTRAKRLFAEGESAYGQKNFERALTLYKQAFDAWPLPGFQFNMGQCYRQLGDFGQAIAAFNLYLEQSPKASNRQTVLALLKAAKRALAQHPAAPVALAPPIAPTPAASAAEPAPSPEEAQTSAHAEVAAPAALTESDEEEPDKPPAVPAASPQPQLATARTAPEAARRLSPTWFWIATAGTGLFAGTAIITGAMALSRNHEFKNSATTDSQRQEAKQSGQALQTATNVSLVCGGLGAAGAVILWKLSYGRAKPSDVSVAWMPGGVLLTTQGRF